MRPTDDSYRRLFKSASASGLALADIGQAWDEMLERSRGDLQAARRPAPSESWKGRRHRLAVAAATVNVCALVTFGVVAPGQARHLEHHSVRHVHRQSQPGVVHGPAPGPHAGALGAAPAI
ncbi:MAG TPA: hypothetical protein VGP46_01640 [Acidimicrobiales bacterium]|nr:hypothetical protein [Acidimicrobiales bacterium]